MLLNDCFLCNLYRLVTKFHHTIIIVNDHFTDSLCPHTEFSSNMSPVFIDSLLPTVPPWKRNIKKLRFYLKTWTPPHTHFHGHSVHHSSSHIAVNNFTVSSSVLFLSIPVCNFHFNLFRFIYCCLCYWHLLKTRKISISAIELYLFSLSDYT